MMLKSIKRMYFRTRSSKWLHERSQKNRIKNQMAMTNKEVNKIINDTLLILEVLYERADIAEQHRILNALNSINDNIKMKTESKQN